MNMRIPILKLDDTLIVSIQWELDDQDMHCNFKKIF